MIYLNNTATSFPKPQEVIDAVFGCINNPPCNNSRSGLEKEPDDVLYSTRIKLAELFNAPDPSHIIFTSGSTESLNLAICGFLNDGDHVVTTGIEHNSVLRPLKTMEIQGKIEVTYVDCDSKSYVSPENIEKAIKPNTRLVVVNHSSNVTGTILDVKTIAEIAHKHGAMIVVDASQTAGALPIDVQSWNIDLLAFTGHKSLFGLMGIGGLYINGDIPLRPLKVGGTGVLSEVLTQPEGFPIYYEAGTPNLPGIMSLAAGVDFINKTGMQNIKNRKSQIVKYWLAELESIPGIHTYYDPEHNSFSNFCFNIDNFVPEEVGYILESSYEIHVRSGLHCAPLLLEPLGVHPWGTVRASPSYFTTDEEAKAFVDAVKEIAEMASKKKR
jgi:cysteine desulfurase / selenocysteine lyase